MVIGLTLEIAKSKMITNLNNLNSLRSDLIINLPRRKISTLRPKITIIKLRKPMRL